jgi:hypothetical protein
MGPRASTPSAETVPATLYITHRRMKQSCGGTSEHVGWVLLSVGIELSRKQVFALMKQDFEFYTQAANGESAKVLRVRCRKCGKKYLTTERDKSKADNLDGLPKFQKP